MISPGSSKYLPWIFNTHQAQYFKEHKPYWKKKFYNDYINREVGFTMNHQLNYYQEQGEMIIRIPCISPPDIRDLGEEETEALLLLLAVELLQKRWEPEVIQGYLQKNARVLMTLETIERSSTKEKIIDELNDEDLEVDIINKVDFIYKRAEKLYEKAASILQAIKEVDKSNLAYGQ